MMPKFEKTSSIRQTRIDANKHPIEKKDEFRKRQSRDQDRKLERHHTEAKRTEWLRENQEKLHMLESLRHIKNKTDILLKGVDQLEKIKDKFHENIKKLVH